MQKILGYKIPMSCTILYMGTFCDENVGAKDRYLVKILLTAGSVDPDRGHTACDCRRLNSSRNG